MQQHTQDSDERNADVVGAAAALQHTLPLQSVELRQAAPHTLLRRVAHTAAWSDKATIRAACLHVLRNTTSASCGDEAAAIPAELNRALASA